MGEPPNHPHMEGTRKKKPAVVGDQRRFEVYIELEEIITAPKEWKVQTNVNGSWETQEWCDSCGRLHSAVHHSRKEMWFVEPKGPRRHLDWRDRVSVLLVDHLFRRMLEEHFFLREHVAVLIELVNRAKSIAL